MREEKKVEERKEERRKRERERERRERRMYACVLYMVWQLSSEVL